MSCTQSSSTDVLRQSLESKGTAHAGNASEQDLVDRLFQDIQTSYANDRIDIAADDNLHDDRRTFGHQDFVAEFFADGSIVGNAARPTLLAIQPELIVIGRATLGMLQAMRQ